MTTIGIERLIDKQRQYFASQHSKSISSRIQLLKNLRKEITAREQDISEALHKDFKKSEFESYLSEIGIVLSELDLTISNLDSWTKPQRVGASLLNFPSSDYIYKEPYGNVLIIAPWNYPFQLAIAPLIGAVSAGNTVILKPSELTPATSSLVSSIVQNVFDDNHVKVVEGGIDISQELLKQRWDYIFFTGSVRVGKIIAKAAAKHLTPVTLELGGKNPCIIDETAKLQLAAKRLVWGKFLNAGQTCIAPDYILVKASKIDALIDNLKDEIVKAYSESPELSEDYPRIINESNFDRLAKMLDNETIAFGGSLNRDKLYVSPTIIRDPELDSDVMRDEIFGPILPIIPYKHEHEIADVINNYEKPLSLYVFSQRKSFIKKMLQQFSFGGGVINDTTVHFGNKKLPFGGVGHSGIGAYHGKHSFETFSHSKSIVKKANWLDIPFRYAPYKGKLNLIKKVLEYLG